MKVQSSVFKENLLVYCALLLVTFAAYFLLFGQFGLYEDDFALIALPANADLRGIFNYLLWILSSNPEGRVLGFLAPGAVSYVLYNISGIPALYLLGWLIVSTNGYLLYLVLRKNFPAFLGLLAALFFVLSPADTAKGYLTHIYQLQLSMLFSLTAIYLYLKRRRATAYFVAACSLFTYEIAFLPFFFAPALSNVRWGERDCRWRQLKHAAICAVMVLSVIAARKLFHEARVDEVILSEALLKTLKGLYVGPVTVMYSYWNALVLAWQEIAFTVFFIAPALAFFAMFFFYYLSPGQLSGPNAKGGFCATEETVLALKAVILGVVMLVFSYVFSGPGTFYPPDALAGRGTSAHLAASVASAVLSGGAAYSLYLLLVRYRQKLLFIPLISIVYASYVGYGGIIQRDFARSWALQQDFWRQVERLCPDLEDATDIVMERKDLPDTKYILAHSWSDAIVLEQLYKFPESWRAPRVLVSDRGFEQDVFVKDGDVYFQTDTGWIPKTYQLREGNTIYLQSAEGVLSRKNSNFKLGKLSFRPKVLGQAAPSLQKQKMYGFMLRD